MSTFEERTLGLIETRGLVAAIEVADAMVKAAKVKLVGKSNTRGGLVMIKIIGEVGAVRAAISAGSQAAERVGELISTHIIPRPDEQTERLVYAEEVEGLESNKAQTKKKLREMTVQQLRQLAREVDDFPFHGRKISTADKETLVKELERLQ